MEILLIIEIPTEVSINMGLQLFINETNIKASSVDICLLYSIVSTAFAPDGNPHKNPSNIGIEQFLDNLNNLGINEK